MKKWENLEELEKDRKRRTKLRRKNQVKRAQKQGKTK